MILTFLGDEGEGGKRGTGENIETRRDEESQKGNERNMDEESECGGGGIRESQRDN